MAMLDSKGTSTVTPLAAPPQRHKMARMRLKWRSVVPLMLMVLPALAYFGIFTYYPLGHAVVISLQKYNLIGVRPFIGLHNYHTALTNAGFWRDFTNTIIIGAGMIIIGFVAPIVIALSLQEVLTVWIRRTFQLVVYLPSLFSWVVVGGLWIELLNPTGGLINGILHLFGVHPVSFMTDPTIARWIIVLVSVWKDAGFNTVIYLAALSGISPVLYEAARIDGANHWQETLAITLPSLVGTMRVVLLLSVMGVLSMFDEIYVMRNAVIEPQVNVLMTYVYDHGFLLFNIGEATAAAVLILVMNLALTIVVRRLVRYEM